MRRRLRDSVLREMDLSPRCLSTLYLQRIIDSRIAVRSKNIAFFHCKSMIHFGRILESSTSERGFACSNRRNCFRFSSKHHGQFRWDIIVRFNFSFYRMITHAQRPHVQVFSQIVQLNHTEPECWK